MQTSVTCRLFNQGFMSQGSGVQGTAKKSAAKTGVAKQLGFTLIELLVVLVLLGLVLSLTVPNVVSWLEGRERSSRIEEFTAKVQHLPLKASTSNQSMLLFDGSELNLDAGRVSFSPALEVLANGYCKGASAILYESNYELEFAISAPFCSVRLLKSTRV
ncbi:prepilin-type N-terminal cleavage/methylation domain-containing protein [Glaciecola siphonariae]|uniref:Prepilin-type N-terminal cleavage/methylation domain-containing protein n=1 Tax=Glaciecola siphonariae TaxID=521012 RepID=A0ABV9LVK4_9ALTE